MIFSVPMRFSLFCLVIVIPGAFAVTLPQRQGAVPTDTLAVFGSSAITAKDFLERIELMPWPGKDRRSEHDSAKARALRSLVAEKLLAQEAAVRGLGRDSSISHLIAGVEQLMVRDELFRREVIGRITISDQEMVQGMRRYPKKLHLLFLRSPSPAAAAELRDSLTGFTPGDSVRLRRSPRLLISADTLLITYGSIDKSLEDTAFALGARRRLSGVIRSDYYGWGIVALLSEGSNPEAVKKSAADRFHAVQTILRARKQNERSAQFSGRVLSPQRAEADSAVFELLASTLETVMRKDSESRKTRGGYRLGAAELDAVESLLGTAKERTLVFIPSGSMTIREVLDGLRTRDFAIPDLDPEPFRDKLNAFVKDVVRAELLTREGYRQNLQNTENVRHDVSVWRDYWTASALVNELRNGVDVSDEEVMAYLLLHAHALGRPYEVNVREVFAESLSTVLQALERITGGEPFGQVARAMSERSTWAAHDGESGYFTVSSMPDLGFAALLADSGAIEGPLTVKGGYSVFQVLGKRIAVTDSVPPPDSVGAVARRVVRAERQRRVVEEFVGELAHKAGVKIFSDRLRALQVGMSNMVTKRYLGFGGVMMAVPTILPLWEWEGQIPADEVP